MQRPFSSVLLKSLVKIFSPKAEDIHLQLFAMKLFWKNERLWDPNAQKMYICHNYAQAGLFFLEADF